MTRIVLFVSAVVASASAALSADAPSYDDAGRVLQRYCAGCHNDSDREGDLSLETFASIDRGTDSGPLVVPGQAENSRLLRVIIGTGEPRMPPEDNERPTDSEIDVLRRWINAGAKRPDGSRPRSRLITPRIAPQKTLQPAVTAMDWSRDGRMVAVARFGRVSVLDARSLRPRWQVDGLGGKVNSVKFSTDGRWLVAASGIAGLYGHAILFEVDSGLRVREFRGHRDTMYAAAISKNGSRLATGSYDREIVVWDAGNGKPLRTLTGHNGAVFDLAFSPDGRVLVSASADETVKLWQADSGERLDTRSEPLGEQYAVAISPDGRFFLGAGADNRIRVWQLVSRDNPRINPLVHSRFAHEGAVVALAFSTDGGRLVSAGEDRTLKLWETDAFTQVHLYERQPDVVSSVAMAPDGRTFTVGRMDGTLTRYEVASKSTNRVTPLEPEPTERFQDSGSSEVALTEHAEAEPNGTLASAQLLPVPFTVTGVIHETGDAADSRPSTNGTDADLYRFSSAAGQTWVVETRAARDESPADTRIEVLHADGTPVERVLLRAVRDSYFTFRGKDSDVSSDFRVHNWEEMELNEYLYSNGEVNRLFMYPARAGFGVQRLSGDRQALGLLRYDGQRSRAARTVLHCRAASARNDIHPRTDYRCSRCTTRMMMTAGGVGERIRI